MKIARFEHKGKMVWGSVHDDGVYILTVEISLRVRPKRKRRSLSRTLNSCPLLCLQRLSGSG